MSIEARGLAEKINNFNTEAEVSKDPKVFEDGRIAYSSILLKITFILPNGLREAVNYLDDKGKLAYSKYFKEKIELEINKYKKK